MDHGHIIFLNFKLQYFIPTWNFAVNLALNFKLEAFCLFIYFYDTFWLKAMKNKE